MPPAMHGIGNDGHVAASEFARAAISGNREQALALLPKLTGACVACHYSYRTR
jgi:cytochrome c556